MARNVEIKARCSDFKTLEATLKRKRAKYVGVLRQVDTYFKVPSGRLKLRELSKTNGELIRYERADESGPKLCSYSILPTDKPAELKQLLSGTLGILGVVKKTRRLYLIGQTRVHLDQVQNLGKFLELEVVLKKGQGIADGKRIAMHLLSEIGLRPNTLVPGSYIDLLVRYDK